MEKENILIILLIIITISFCLWLTILNSKIQQEKRREVAYNYQECLKSVNKRSCKEDKTILNGFAVGLGVGAAMRK